MSQTVEVDVEAELKAVASGVHKLFSREHELEALREDASTAAEPYRLKAREASKDLRESEEFKAAVAAIRESEKPYREQGKEASQAIREEAGLIRKEIAVIRSNLQARLGKAIVKQVLGIN